MSRRRVSDYETAERLHRASIRLLRALRQEDRKTGLSAPRLSALSVLVFDGPKSVSALAAAEHVRLPSMSRLVKEMQRDGLVKRRRDPVDRRVSMLQATPKGNRVMKMGRGLRLTRLAEELSGLARADRDTLAEAAKILQEIF
jgi:DNA-binding MarR family transcriptional regulator